jgi:prephenate dehydratase
MPIAIQGDEGSFHHQAAQEWFGQPVELTTADTFGAVFNALDNHTAQTAVVAVENSLYGSINEVLDLIQAHHYPIVGEIYLRIKQQLIGTPHTAASDIKYVYSHPVALAQCEQYLDAHFPNAQRVEYHDTAASVAFIKQKNGDPAYAAIASAGAAKLHNMPILASNIEDNKANFTRFLVIQPDGTVPKNANKTSLLLTTDHTPGALARVLTLFADANANLTKLQSRPIIGDAWKYRFYIDIEVAGESLHQLLTHVCQTGATVTVLGEYVAGVTH